MLAFKRSIIIHYDDIGSPFNVFTQSDRQSPTNDVIWLMSLKYTARIMKARNTGLAANNGESTDR